MSLEESVQHVLMNAIQEVNINKKKTKSIYYYLFCFQLMVKENRKINEEYSELGDQVNQKKYFFEKKLFFLVLVKTCIRRT